MTPYEIIKLCEKTVKDVMKKKPFTWTITKLRTFVDERAYYCIRKYTDWDVSKAVKTQVAKELCKQSIAEEFNDVFTDLENLKQDVYDIKDFLKLDEKQIGDTYGL